MININTGDITIGDWIISPIITRKDVELSNRATLILQNKDYSNYRTTAISSEGQTWIIVMYFDKERITDVSLSISSPNYKSWDDWSETHELGMLEVYRNYLKQSLEDKGKQIEGEYKYKWGTVSVIFDRKAGDSYIYIHYSKSFNLFNKLWTSL